MVFIVGCRIETILIGPIDDGLVLPPVTAGCTIFAIVEYAAVVHKVRHIRLVVVLQVGVVGKHTEAAAIGLGFRQLRVVKYASPSRARDGTVLIGIEAYGDTVGVDCLTAAFRLLGIDTLGATA